MNIARRHGLVFRNVRRVQATSARTVLLEGVKEEQFQEHVLTTAAFHGWHGIHILHSKANVEALHSPNRRFPRGADHDDAYGFPDLVLVHPARHLLILAELKVKRRKLRPEQELWKQWCSGLHLDCRHFAWWPEDEPEIQHILSEGWTA